MTAWRARRLTLYVCHGASGPMNLASASAKLTSQISSENLEVSSIAVSPLKPGGTSDWNISLVPRNHLCIRLKINFRNTILPWSILLVLVSFHDFLQCISATSQRWIRGHFKENIFRHFKDCVGLNGFIHRRTVLQRNIPWPLDSFEDMTTKECVQLNIDYLWYRFPHKRETVSTLYKVSRNSVYTKLNRTDRNKNVSDIFFYSRLKNTGLFPFILG